MKKSIIVTLLVVFLLLIVLFPIGSLILMNEPIIEVQNVKVTDITWSTMNFEVILAITNPYPFGVTVTELTYTIVAENPDKPLLLANGTTEGMEDIKVAGSSITEILVPAQIYNSEVLSAGIELFKGDVELIVSGSAKIDLKVFQPRIPFSKQFVLTREEILMEITGTKDLVDNIKSEIRNAGVNIALKLLLPS